jgi:hypothetical protein
MSAEPAAEYDRVVAAPREARIIRSKRRFKGIWRSHQRHIAMRTMTGKIRAIFGFAARAIHSGASFPIVRFAPN